MKLSVLIPVYNEKNTIREIIKRVQATGRATEIVIVDDGSKDGTREVLAELDGKDGVRVILHEKNAGKGAALRTAIRSATGDVIWNMIRANIRACLNPSKKTWPMLFTVRVFSAGHTGRSCSGTWSPTSCLH
jgi:hypothetical protein